MERTLSEEEDDEILMPAPLEQIPNPIKKSIRLERRDSRNSDINKPFNTADKAELIQGITVLAPQIIHQT